jgi:acyl carrier protein
MTPVQATAARCLAKVLRLPAAHADAFDPQADLFTDHAMTSLDMVLFMTSVCEACGVPLTQLDENDLAEVKTLCDVVQLLDRKQLEMENDHALEQAR